MRCRHFRKYLVPYVEGTLPEDLRESMTVHAASCEECAGELAELRQTVEFLQGAEFEAMEPAPDLRSRVMARISERPTRSAWWTGRLQAYSSAAVALLLFALVLTAVQPLFRSGDEAVEVAPSVITPSEVKPGKDLPDGEHAEKRSVEDGFTELTPPARALAPAERPRIEPPAQPPSVRTEPRDRDYADASTRLPSEDGRKFASPGEKKESVTGGISREGFFSKSAPGVEEEARAVHPDFTSVADGAPAAKTGEELAGHGGPAPVIVESADKPMNGSERAGVLRKGSDQKLREERVLYLETKLKDFPANRRVLEELLADYRELGRAEDEYAIAKRLTELEPGNGSYWFARAQAAERAGMPRTAAAAYRRAIELKIGEPEMEVAKSRLEALESPR